MADEKKRPHLHVEFFTEPVENKHRSKKEGRPIFEDREFVRIRFAGDNTRVHVAPATEITQRDMEGNGLSYVQRFPKHYEAFKAGQEYIGDGIPLSELPFLTESKRAELRALNIHTAETLAALEGSNLARLGMGGRKLKDQAQSWIESAQGSAVSGKLAQENEELRAQMAVLQEQMAELMGNAAPQAPEPLPDDRLEEDGPFVGMPNEDLKAYIKDQTGQMPKGNPSRKTLLAMAEECNPVTAAA